MEHLQRGRGIGGTPRPANNKGMGGGKKDFWCMGANPTPGRSRTNCDFETSESQLFRIMIKGVNKA